MLKTYKPSQQSLNTHTEAAVGRQAVSPQLKVPLHAFRAQLMLFYSLQQSLIIMYPLPSCCYFSITLRSQQVCTKGYLLTKTGFSKALLTSFSASVPRSSPHSTLTPPFSAITNASS